MSTDPSVCFSQSPFGFGPFPIEGGTLACVPHPPGAGYGGVDYGLYSDIWGETGYGLGAYGGASNWPTSPLAVTGGYGGDPYGLGSYGSTDVVAPQVSSALSLNGFEIEVFFSEGMQPGAPALLDPSSYILIPVTGAPSVVSNVRVGNVGTTDVAAGDYVSEVTSVILTHTGTTLGGTYTLRVDGPVDLGGNPAQASEISILTRGEAPAHTIVPTAGNKLLVTFDQEMLPVAEYPTSPSDNPHKTILSTDEWGFEDARGVTPPYPVELTAQEVTFPFEGDSKKVEIRTLGQTSILYRSRLSPAFSVDWDAEDGDPTTISSPDYLPILIGSGASGEMSGGNYRLTLSPAPGYSGLGFVDLTGRPATGSSLRVDLNFERVSFTPAALAVDVFGLGFLDTNQTEADLWCGYDGVMGAPYLLIHTGPGGFSQVLYGYDWTSGSHTLSIVYNQKLGQAVWLFDEQPVYATPLANLRPPATPTTSVVALVASNTTSLVDPIILDLSRLHLTASSTIFSGAWNFLHEESSLFTGSEALTKSWLETKRGPLVKGHGDGTPATKADVTVEVNGTAVEVSQVNPYTGRVETVIPVPLMPPGSISVDVNYQWMASPRMAFRGLNTKGLVLNKYDSPRGHHNPVGRGQENQDLPDYPKGSAPTQRFPYTILLGPLKSRPTPKFIAHRYLGFERAYSAILNSPTTLRLNNHPNRYQVPGFVHGTTEAAVSFDGTTTPQAAPDPWMLFGSDAGQQNASTGTYTVIDAVAGNPDIDNPPVALYSRALDLSFPASVYVVGRFVVSGTPVPDGVWTGVGFGLHNARTLYLAGALLVNGLEHVGLCLNPDKPHLVESWQIGPGTTLTVNAGQSTCTVSTSGIPQDATVGDRFQILEGTQAGVYTLTSVVNQTDGTTTLGVTPSFPAFHDLYGNKFPNALFETKWSVKPATYRLTVSPSQETAVLQMSGERTTTVTSFDGVGVLLPSPAETSAFLPPPVKQGGPESWGSVFWGSFSQQASNEAEWSFFRYGVTPDTASVRGHVQTVRTDLAQYRPDENPDDFGWALESAFGSSTLVGSGMLLKSTSGNRFGYGRLEAFLTPEAGVDLRAVFRVESGGETEIGITNGQRRVSLHNLLYVEGGAERLLVEMPEVIFTGLLDPTAQGWTNTTGFSLSKTFYQQSFLTTGEGGWLGELGGSLAYASTGRVFEMQVAVPSHTANANGDTGIEMTAEVGSAPYKAITLTLRGGSTPGVRLVSGTSIIGQFDFDWTDGEYHIFRCVADTYSNTLLTYVDGVLRSTLDMSLFTAPGSGNTYMSLGSFGTDINGAGDPAIAASVEWRAASNQAIPLSSVKRTLGVRTNSGGAEINDYKVPRMDGTSVPNSSPTAQVVEWDWRSDMDVRVVLDPLWGASVLRPDLSLPNTYQGESSAAGTGFHTRKVEPSAAWINVEYGLLPKLTDNRFGMVRFGHFGQDVAQSYWSEFQYEIYRHWKDDIKQPEMMVLNKFNIITSGELTQDTILETVETVTLDSRRVTLKPFHIYASRVYKVVDTGKPVGEQIFTDEMWDFDFTSQTLTLQPDRDGNPRTFSTAHAQVSVVFFPGKPVTVTYLQGQEFLDSLTKLNERTPPYPKSQVAQTGKRVAVANDLRLLDDPEVSLSANVLGDPDRFLDHAAPDNDNDQPTYYEQMTFFEVDNGGETGLIQFPCEATELDGISGFNLDEGEDVYDSSGEAVGKVGKPFGGFVVDLSGTLFWEDARRNQPFTDRGMPGSILFAAGGAHAGPVDSAEHVYAGHVPALAGVLNSTPLHPLVNMQVLAALITNSGQIIPLDGSQGIPSGLIPVQ